MEQIHYITNRGIASTGVDPLQQCIVAVPGTRELRVTLTYTGQVASLNQAVMSWGDTTLITKAILPTVRNPIETGMQPIEVAKLDSSSARAKLFLEYCDRELLRVSSLIRERISTNSLSNRQVPGFAKLVYDRLHQSNGADHSIMRAIADYIRNGQAGLDTLHWFSEHVNPIFGKLAMHEQAKSRLETAVTESIDHIKSGADKGKVALGGLEDINPLVYDSLRELTGTKPGRHFLSTIDEVVKGESANGLIVPFKPRIGNQVEIPDELKPHYMRIQELGRIITRFDRVIAAILLAYAAKNEQVQTIARKLESERRVVPYELLMRAVFPEHHKPTLTLYSDKITGINDPDMRRIVELVKDGRADIPKVVEESFGIPQEEVRFEELVSLQANLMHLLPFPVYVCTDIYHRLRMSIPQARKHQARLTQPQRVLLMAYTAQESRLRRDFGVDADTFKSPNAQTDEDIVRLFGDEFLFTKRIKHKFLQN